MKSWVAIALMASTFCAQAQDRPAPADLPPTALARQWIDQDAAVREARSGLEAAGHGAGMLRAGPHEWTTRVTMQRRNYQSGGPDSKEWNAQLERGIRVNGKAKLDDELADVELAVARARVGEAIHESARSLVDLWVDAALSAQAESLYRAQQTFAQQNLRAVDARKRAGDASSLDLAVASADAADVDRQASQAKSTLDKARARLRVRFPDAQAPERALGNPSGPEGPQSQWLDRALQASDVMRIAEGQLRKAELTASRASADRVADPTVGVFAASESFRQERIVGVSISIPLGGTYRRERSLQAMQEAEAARSALDRQRRELETSIAETYTDASGNFSRWQLAEQGAAASNENAQLTQRAYALGEADLQSLLLARRQFLDASRAALEARAEALRAHYRLLVDAHLIWNLSDD